MSRTYTLELTAEELLTCARGIGIREGLVREKVMPLIEQAKADREADELRLPWRAEDLYNGAAIVKFGNGFFSTDIYGRRAANLMSAAPELFEAVKAFDRLVTRQWHKPDWATYEREVVPLIDRALRKVESGQPEGE